MDSRDLEILESITKYLDYTGQLNKFLKTIHDLEKIKTTPECSSSTVSFCFNIDFAMLLEIAGNAANILLKEPYACLQLFNKITNLIVKSEESFQKRKIGNIYCTLQITLPPVQALLSFPGKCIYPSSGLFVIKGIIMAKTIPTKYCKSAVYRCPLKDCSGHIGERVFGEQTTPGICTSCGCKEEEFLRARVNGDQVLAVFIHPDSFQYNFLRHQGINILFRDNLINDLVLGRCYNVVVSSKSSYLQGWGIEMATSSQQRRYDKYPPSAFIPHAIILLRERLQETCPNSPWALTATLASQLASHLYPLNSFFQLKTGLLLSLASQGVEGVPVPILAVGPDCCLLLEAVSQLSERRVAVTSPALCGAMGVSVGALWMEAGPLLLATGGVCYIGDWAKFGSGCSSVTSQIITALESGKLDLVDPNNSLLGSRTSQSLRAAVWTFWSGDKATTAAQAQLRTLIEVFGMPFIGDGSTDIEAVAKHLLSEAMQLDTKTANDLIVTDDLKKYLKIACSIKVQLTSEASKLLRNYFVASRRERPDCLPLTAIKTMTALAEAHARLCLRTDVLYEDVVLVVYLYEEAITTLFGPSLMSLPSTAFENLNIDPNSPMISQQVHVLLTKFSLWLEQYIKSLLSENSVNYSISEE